MNHIKFFLTAVVFLIFCSAAWADIPKQINFQGILKDSLGNPYPDGNYSITFRIYDAASGGNILWQEGQLIAISGGLFTHLLGSAIPIPESVFDDSLRWLGIQVAGNPEITPRRQLVSVPYSYVADLAQSAEKLGTLIPSDVALITHNHNSDYAALSHTHTITSVDIQNGTIVDLDISNSANISPSKVLGTAWTSQNDTSGSGLNADLLDGLNSTDFLNTATDYGRSGVAVDLYEGASTLSSKYVNVTGPDSVVSTFGTAFLGKVSGSFGPLYGIQGSANSSSGEAYGGYFATSSSGTGSHFGVRAEGYASSANSAVGSYGLADNTGAGPAYGGLFYANPTGTGPHYGVRAEGYGSTSAATYGSYGLAFSNFSSTGAAYGGFFTTNSSGTGTHYGVLAEGSGSSSASTYGSYVTASNTSTGLAYAGYFLAFAGGTAAHYGVYGAEAAGGLGAAVYAAGDFAASGTKSAVVKTSSGEKLYYTIESPEVWFEDFGEGQLSNGKAHIELDALFSETVTINSTNPMKVFIQLNDPNCNGIAVVRGTTGFDVVELQNGISNASFSYRIVAKRKGYENQRLPQTTLGMDDPNLYPELWQEIEKRHQEAKIQQELQK